VIVSKKHKFEVAVGDKAPDLSFYDSIDNPEALLKDRIEVQHREVVLPVCLSVQ
jgi:hypothetical protein